MRKKPRLRLGRFGFGRVRFLASGGQTERLLSLCMQNGIQLARVTAVPGGFRAVLPAAAYPRLRPLARRCRTRLRIEHKWGPVFLLRGVLRRPGLLLGPLVFWLALQGSRNVVWSVRFVQIPAQEQAALRRLLYQAELCEGSLANAEKIAAARLMLQEQAEGLGWVALNFYDGRLVVERTQAMEPPAPPQLEYRDRTAAENATILSCNVLGGFCTVTPGQTVARGQVLISASRATRDEGLVWQQPQGTVTGLVQKTFWCSRTLSEDTWLLTGRLWTRCALRTPFGRVELPTPGSPPPHAQTATHAQPLTLLGFALPATLERTVWAEQAPARRVLSQQAAREFAHYTCLTQLYAQYPDAQIAAQTVEEEWEGDVLQYRLTLQFAANIAQTE